MFEYRNVRGHVEVYLDGRFCFSADTRAEAEHIIRAAESHLDEGRPMDELIYMYT